MMPVDPCKSQRLAISEAILMDEADCVQRLLPLATLDSAMSQRVHERATGLVERSRAWARQQGGFEAFMHEYDLSSQEGVILMCLAEALVRIPDAETADRLIRDKLGQADWEQHLGHSDSLFVNAGTWGLMLTGRLVRLDAGMANDVAGFLRRLIARSGEPVLRLALREAMQVIGHQYVMADTMEAAVARSQREFSAYRFSYDMLGEAALSSADAEHYLARYHSAIEVLARLGPWPTINEAPSISVKLSALHPRFEQSQRSRVLAELVPRVLSLARVAADAGLGLTLDAEEANRLELSLNVFVRLFADPDLADWPGLGLALQAYQKRALPVLDWLGELAQAQRKPIMLRLVKGAYWDAEIKRAQELGLEGYPVFTRKAHTDVSYLACVRRIFAAGEAFSPQFATHNAHTVASVLELAGKRRDFEFQRLHGMGEGLYGDQDEIKVPCRTYAPVGGHKELLPYLVRRLLENGANTSFVNRLVDATVPIDTVVADPCDEASRSQGSPHPGIPLPVDLFGSGRRNSLGLDLDDPLSQAQLLGEIADAGREAWQAMPVIDGEPKTSAPTEIHNPADSTDVVGHIFPADAALAGDAMTVASQRLDFWSHVPASQRADILDRAADLLEVERPALMARIIREGGRCLADALAEVREAVDFCRYYAQRARVDFAEPRLLTGPTGERNELSLHGRGVFVCISPWNFPVAIFTGQIAAALATGNTVVAKPAALTSLTASLVVELFHRAGLPAGVLNLLPGAGEILGQGILADQNLAGVAFTGSTATARSIQQALARRDGAIVPLIAETGGQNVMIADSSALPEQLVTDVLRSAFNSAGQRCSALRVLFVQDDIATRVIELLRGAMAELRLGNPAQLATDIGPLISATAAQALRAHVQCMKQRAQLLAESEVPAELSPGHYVQPHAFEIDRLSRLEGEVFGPVLHVIRFQAGKLDAVIEAVNASGYGLTLGLHSRIETTADYIRQRVRVGNLYINRNMIGAQVGVQPFGGEGLSGTGPKAGGEFYLHRFATERVVSINTAAVGGNTSLLALDDDH